MSAATFGQLVAGILFGTLVVFGMRQCYQDIDRVGHTWYCPRLGANVDVISVDRRSSPPVYLCRYAVGQGPDLRVVEVHLIATDLMEKKP